MFTQEREEGIRTSDLRFMRHDIHLAALKIDSSSFYYLNNGYFVGPARERY
jgi:hypothetical protein